MPKVNLTKKQIDKLDKKNLNLITASCFYVSQGKKEYVVKICRKDNKRVGEQGTSKKNLDTAINNAINNLRNNGNLMT